MKRIELHKLMLKDFKGLSFTLEPEGLDLNVYGANATGKTTLADAWHWILFDKDSLGRSDFQIKNLDSQGEEEHGLLHTVEAHMTIDGEFTVLKKIFKELWQKKRGSAKAVRTGHTSEYFINGVPVQLKDYKDQIKEFVGDETVFQLITSPIVFTRLPWQKQRAALFEICGDVTDAQVIEHNHELAELPAILDKKTLDDHRKIVLSRRKEINEQLKGLPIRIDEVRIALPDIDGLDYKTIINNIGVLETTINDAKAKLHGIDNGAIIADLSKRLAGVNADIRKIEQEHYNAVMAEANKIQQEIINFSSQRDSSDRQDRSAKAEIENKQSRLKSIEEQLNKLREKWTAIDGKQFQNTVIDVCPACNQALPHDQVEEARQKALEEFNENKASRLADIETQGKFFASEKDRITQELLALQESTHIEKFDYNARIAELTESYKARKAQAENYDDLVDRTEFLEERAEYERDIAEARESVKVDREVIEQGIAELDSLLKMTKAEADKFNRRDDGMRRIEELKRQEKELSAEYEELEKQIFLCELFIRTKVSLLTDRINEKFKLVRFKLFNELVNGGIEECCEMTIGGVPFSSGLNSAARVQGGLDIVRVLQAHHGLLCPVWLDNRESFTEIPEMSCQTISLYVSPADTKLRVEKAVQKKKAA